jgi:hypothetical protein
MSFNVVTDPQADLKVFAELKQVLDPQAPDEGNTLLDIVMDYTGDYGTTEVANPVCRLCGPVLTLPCAVCVVWDATLPNFNVDDWH